MNIQEEIFKSIENLARTSNTSKTDFPTVILSVEKNKCKVKIDGAMRTAINGIGLELKVGDSVWCHAMNGNIGQLYVISRR